MKRLIALALGAPLVFLASLALGPGDVRAGGSAVRALQPGQDEGQKSEKPAEKKVEKKVVVHHAGGGRLGVVIAEPAGDLRGALIRSVEPGSAAEQAGLKQEDVIVRFDGETVRGTSHLVRLVDETPSGKAVAIEVRRGQASEKLTATLAEGDRRLRVFSRGGHPGLEDFEFEVEAPEFVPAPPDAPMPPSPPAAPLVPHVWKWKGDGGDMVFRTLGGPRKLGIEYMELGEQLAAYFKLSGKSGVLVTAVDTDSPAAKAGIKAGDVILKFDGATIDEASDLRDAVSEAEGGEEVTVTVQRDGRPLDLKATLAKPEPKRKRRETRGVSL